MRQTAPNTRKNEIDEQAAAFSAANPQVSKLFVKFTIEAIERGFSNYSVNAIFERIRWESDSADGDGRSTFKINNNYRSWYARRFMQRYPHHAGFFRTRARISGDDPATGLPELTPHDYQERTTA